MNKQKNILLAALLFSTLILPPPKAEAQAEQLVGGLIQQVLPVVIPMVITTVPLVIVGGAKVVPMVGSYIKERVPMPHLLKKKGKPGAADSNTADATSTESATEAPTGDEKLTYKTSVTGNLTSDEKAQNSDEGKHAELAAPLAKPAPADPSKWYMD